MREQAHLLALSFDAIIARTPEDKVVYWNTGAETIYGYTAQEARGQVTHRLLKTSFPEPLEQIRAQLERAGKWEGELVHTRKDGAQVMILSRWAAERDAAGRILRVLESNTDITDRKRAEEALRESEARFQVLTRNLQSGVALVDEQGAFCIVNSSFRRIFDIPDDADILNINSRDWEQWQVFDEQGLLLDINQHPARKAALRRTAVQNQLVAVKSPAGPELKWLLVSAEPILDKEGRLHRLVCTYYDITERRRAEQALRESEERFRVAQEVSPDGFLLFRPLRDPTGAITDFLWLYENDAAARMNDTQPKEVCGKKVSEVLPHHDQSPFHKAYKEVAETGEVRVLEEAFYDQDTFQQRRWFRVAAVPAAGGDVAILVQNVTERKRAEEALRESERLLREFLEQLPVGAALMDAQGKLRVSNAAYRRLVPKRIPSRDPEGLKRWRAWEADGRLVEPANWPGARALRGERVVPGMEFLFTEADGREVWLRVSAVPFRGASGEIVGAISAIEDMDAVKRAGERLKESEERFRVAQELSPDGFAILRPVRAAQGQVVDFTWIYENEAIARMNGTDPHTIVGRRLLDLFPGQHDTQFMKAYQQVVQTGERCVFEARYAGESFPQPLWLRIAVVPLGKDIAIQAQDITRQKEFQAELERLVAERTAKLQELVSELEHFSYTITHDMRAPLRAMQGFAEMFAETCTGCQQQDAQRFLQRIRTSANRMDALIVDALSYSKAVRQDLPLEPVDLGPLLRGMLDTYPELQSSRAQIEIQGEFPLVLANQAGLTQCFSNLLGNASKFARPGQKPEIRIWAETRPAPAAPQLPDSLPARPPILNPHPPATAVVRVWVEDNGIGIPKLMLPRVFDMFSRGHNSYEGTGIGLALVRKVMDRMGGRVGVESEEGQGSRFWLELTPAQ